MDIAHVFGLDSENSEDFRYQTVWIIAEMVRILGQQVNHEVKFRLRTSFDNELFIVAMEKEGSTAASSLSALENHISVKLGTQTLVEHVSVEVVFEGASESVHAVESHICGFIHNDHVFLFCPF
jgi:hypothetical protein